ncbi:metallophosphoesterase family protein [Paenibacillus polymyxa]|uniref:metallophosphoesterase family protein n=1 Tax=Paenibacillus polymyxa TaxID=1406 RepID=UPI0001E6D38F|nr:metallophosphoesterase family protein [Paenibacillus polymyxa]WPQ60005.1 metallophosphoesterase family protein [Paenibacillus polymyxa]
MKALIMSDLQWIDQEEWRKVLEMNQDQFDVVFLLGDINQMLLQKIVEVFGNKGVYGVHGDFGFEGDLEYYGAIDCHGRVVELKGMKVAGVEGSNRYKAGPYPMHTQQEISMLCEELPPVDILLCHNSPSGYHDQAGHPVYQGFRGVHDYMDRCHPRFLFHGHHHVNTVDYYMDTTLVGVFGVIIYDFKSKSKECVLELSMEKTF